MLYFAYGSNLNTARFTARVEGATIVNVASIADHSLAFNKLSADSSAKANIMPVADSVVQGVVYNIPRSQKRALDTAEGKGYGYNMQRFTTTDGQRVFAYVADTDAYTDNAVYSWYMDLVVTGMQQHNFTAQYIQRNTSNITVVEDPSAQITTTLTEAYTAGMLIRQHVIVPKYYRQADADKQVMLHTALTALNALFNTNTQLAFILTQRDSSNYNADTDTITLHTLSVMTFIHEFAHALQQHYTLTQYTDVEEDARCWSHTVFFICAPQMYIKAKNDGKFYHEDINMLAPLSDTDGLPADNVLKNRFYKYFDAFVTAVKEATVHTLTATELRTITAGHTSLTQHVNKMLA